MRNGATVLVLGAAVVGAWAVAVVCSGNRPDHAACLRDAGNPPVVNGGVAHGDRRHHPYGKIELPADVAISLAQDNGPGGPAAILVTVSSAASVKSGILSLRVPGLDAEPNHTEVLWAGVSAGPMTQTAVYDVASLPVGQHCFTAAFEFTPSGDDAEAIATSQSLYLDVRPTGILSSNVSFEQIQRLELRRELERRVLAGLKPGLSIASEEAAAAELARLEAADPGFLDRRIAELEASDPEVARRILELNERQALPVDDEEAAR